jgi:hypothetical protein
MPVSNSPLRVQRGRVVDINLRAVAMSSAPLVSVLQGSIEAVRVDTELEEVVGHDSLGAEESGI